MILWFYIMSGLPVLISSLLTLSGFLNPQGNVATNTDVSEGFLMVSQPNLVNLLCHPVTYTVHKGPVFSHLNFFPYGPDGEEWEKNNS